MSENPRTISSLTIDAAASLSSFVDANTVAAYSPVTSTTDAFDNSNVNGYLFSSFPDQVCHWYCAVLQVLHMAPPHVEDAACACLFSKFHVASLTALQSRQRLGHTDKRSHAKRLRFRPFRDVPSRPRRGGVWTAWRYSARRGSNELSAGVREAPCRDADRGQLQPLQWIREVNLTACTQN